MGENWCDPINAWHAAGRSSGETGPPQAYVETYGCQMNVHESEVIAGLLEGLGYQPAGAPEDADLVILNTCCVRETAEERVLGRLGELQRLKTRRPGLLLAVAGCLGQQAGAADRIRRRATQVDLILGTHNLYRLPELVSEVVRRRLGGDPAPVVEVAEGREAEVREGLPVRREGGIRAWVTIMYGCDNFCSYCIVPHVRGRERSRRADDILAEVRQLADAGYREVYLLGQNVNSYALDLRREAGTGAGGDAPSFAGLLRAVNEVPGLARIRYTTSHPRDFTDDIITAVAECDKVCEHFHLPAQSGSTRVLELMNRRYTREQYLELIQRIRRRVPEAVFTADLIVGFPGETEADFEATLSLVREVPFDASFDFAYSPRSGTPAAEAPEQVPGEVKKRRLQRLIEVQNQVSLAQNRRRVGTMVEVLAEGAADRSPERAVGRDRGNKLVIFDPPAGTAPADLSGQVVSVLVEQAHTWSLEGRARS